MTGWRVGYAHGPSAIIDSMNKIQQYTFVCSPHPAQWAAVEALTTDIAEHVDEYHAKRDRLIAGLESDYQFITPGGAFYLFVEAPGGNGSAFVERAIAEELVMIPGKVFSNRDSHFRLSYAAEDSVIDRGIEVLKRLAQT